MSRIVIFASAAAIALVVAVGAFFALNTSTSDAYASCRMGSVAGDIGGPFTLVNGDGEVVADTDVITQPSLVYFGYTFCPDACPFDMARNAEAVDVLAEAGHDVLPIFISIDPARDTPEVVKEYASLMHENAIGLTGSPEQVKAASQAYRTYYKAQPAEDEFYLVDHSTFTYLVLPEEGFVDFFRRELEPDQMAERVGCFLENT